MDKYIIRRGTTPTHTFTLPVKSEDVEAIYVTYAQFETAVVELSGDDVSLTDVDTDAGSDSGSVASITLSQTDTLLFNSGASAQVQVRFRSNDGTAFASQKIKIIIEDVVKDGVI